jgi:hypothetical protein
VMNDSRSVLHAVLPSKSVGDCLRRLFFFSYPHLIRITFWIVWMSGRRYSNKRGGAFGYVCKGKKKNIWAKLPTHKKESRRQTFKRCWIIQMFHLSEIHAAATTFRNSIGLLSYT